VAAKLCGVHQQPRFVRTLPGFARRLGCRAVPRTMTAFAPSTATKYQHHVAGQGSRLAQTAIGKPPGATRGTAKPGCHTRPVPIAWLRDTHSAPNTPDPRPAQPLDLSKPRSPEPRIGNQDDFDVRRHPPVQSVEQGALGVGVALLRLRID